MGEVMHRPAEVWWTETGGLAGRVRSVGMVIEVLADRVCMFQSHYLDAGPLTGDLLIPKSKFDRGWYTDELGGEIVFPDSAPDESPAEKAVREVAEERGFSAGSGILPSD